MKISISRDRLLRPLSHVNSVIERRQTLPILSNVHLRMVDGTLTLTGTDLELEVVARVGEVEGENGEITVAGRKLLDICRVLPEGAAVVIEGAGSQATIKAGRSRFRLQVLSAEDFPRLEAEEWTERFEVEPSALRMLLERTAFAMAQQDVRYYLNGMLWEFREELLRAVATDGHRLAKTEESIKRGGSSIRQLIVPRKAVQELIRVLDGEEPAEIGISRNHLRVAFGEVVLTTKLIDGRYPDYEKVIPGAMPTRLVLDRAEFRAILNRAAVLTNEKFRGVRLTISPGQLTVTAHNPDQEEASDAMAVEYEGPEFEIGFNVTYMIDAVNALTTEAVELDLKDHNSSCVLSVPGDRRTLYLIMPMRL